MTEQPLQDGDRHARGPIRVGDEIVVVESRRAVHLGDHSSGLNERSR